MAMVRNTICWAELPVTDLDRSITFYSAVLDAEVKKMSEAGFEFGLLPYENENVAGCLYVMPDRKPSSDGALVYLNVEGRLEDAVTAALNNAGKLISPKTQMGPWGFRALIQDTEGNVVALHSQI